MVIEEAERVARALEAADVTVLGALSPGPAGPGSAHRLSIRTGRAELAVLEAADPIVTGCWRANAWPLAATEALGRLPL